MKTEQAAATDVGRVRGHNEDAYYAAYPLFAIADGMGGHEAGEVASSIALESLTHQERSTEMSIPDWLSHAVRTANAAVFRAGATRDGGLRMGTTLTSAYVSDNAIYLAHVGDSRAYLFRDGELRQITNDHSLVAEYVRDGRISEEEALVHPQRSVITRALGIEPDVAVDSFRVLPIEGDRILICSDGLSGFASNDEMATILADEKLPDTAVRRLIDLANSNGGEDNITAILIDVVAGPVVVEPEVDDASTVAHPETVAPEVGGGSTGDAAPMPDSVISNHISSNYEPSHDDARSDGEHAPAVDIRKRPSKVPIIIKTAIWIVVLAAAVAGGWVGYRWFASNSYYVGVQNGDIAIFQGNPQSILGIRSNRLIVVSTTPIAQLPTPVQSDIEAGIPVDSLSDAKKTVDNFSRQAAQDQQLQSDSTTTTSTTRQPEPG